MTLIDQLRQRVVLYRVDAKLDPNSEAWKKRRTTLCSHFKNQNNPIAQEIIAMGDDIGPAFKVIEKKGRSQEDLSGGGNVWEALVMWYLNLCYVGTPVIAVAKPFIPETLLAAQH